MISFPFIPAGGQLLVPGFYVDFDPSQASYGSTPQRGLIIGQALTNAGTVPQLLTGVDAARTRYGAGSVIAEMVDAYRQSDPFGELWALPLAANGSAVAATGTVAFSGTATAAGSVPLYIGGKLVSVAVASGATAATVATAMEAAINADTRYAATATRSTATLTLTARNGGTVGNQIDLRLAYRGAAGGEAMPAGITATLTPFSGGSGDPSLASLAAQLGDIEFDFIDAAWSDTTALDAYRTLMSDATGRWSYLSGAMGHVFTAARGDAAALQTIGAARNDPHVSIMGVFDTPTPLYRIAAGLAGTVAVAIRADAARPLSTLAIPALQAPPLTSNFTLSTRNTLLSNGIMLPSYDADGTARILRAVTTYQKNPANLVDRSLLAVEALTTLTEITRRARQRFGTKFARSKLADDGTRFGPGQPVVTPKLAFAELVALYDEMERDGLVENAAGMKAATRVERNTADPNRLDILWAPNLINQLQVVAVLNQFRS